MYKQGEIILIETARRGEPSCPRRAVVTWVEQREGYVYVGYQPALGEVYWCGFGAIRSTSPGLLGTLRGLSETPGVDPS